MLLDALSPKFAEAQQVPKDDARLKTESVEFASPKGYGKMRGYLVRPAKADGQAAGASWSSTRTAASTRTSRTSPAGSRSTTSWRFAPDALFPLGGYPGDEDKARELFPKLDQAKTREDFVAAARLARRRGPTAPARSARSASATAAASSTCWRRACPTWRRRCRSTAVSPSAEDVAKIKAPLLIQSAENDERINAGWPAYEAALKANKVPLRALHVYPGTQHGFNNDTTPRYDETAAKLAWERTIEFFNKHLKAG